MAKLVDKPFLAILPWQIEKNITSNQGSGKCRYLLTEDLYLGEVANRQPNSLQKGEAITTVSGGTLESLQMAGEHLE